MLKSSKSVIDHIPNFLDYCQKKGLSINTQKNYQRYLRKFISWLKYKKLEDIKPHELTAENIWNYHLYLSRNIDPKTGKSLKKTTQNYYLIALRALLGYFSTKDVSLAPSR